MNTTSTDSGFGRDAECPWMYFLPVGALVECNAIFRIGEKPPGAPMGAAPLHFERIGDDDAPYQFWNEAGGSWHQVSWTNDGRFYIILSEDQEEPTFEDE